MRAFFVSLVLLILFAGCAVGPDYTPPITPMPDSYSEDKIDETFSIDDENLKQWWCIFEDPFLSQLLEETIDHNFDYRIALEQVYQARSQYWVQFTQILPELEADTQATRFRTSRSFATAAGAASTSSDTVANNAKIVNTTAISAPIKRSPIQNFFQIGLDAVWEIDIFGKLRRSAQAAYDTWQASVEESRSVKIIVLSEVANTYVTICSLQAKISLAIAKVNLDEDLLHLSLARFETHLTNLQEVETAKAALEADKVTLITFETALKQSIYSLAILLGRLPETLLDDFNTVRPIPYAKGKVPAGLPSDLLRRRPDIRFAERQLAAATEQIGVAVADLYPTFSLTGSSSSFAANPLQGANIGLSSDSLNKLFKPASRIWGIGMLVTMPAFDFGKRAAAVNVQVALEHQAYISYQKAVITALQEVEQALITYFNEEKIEFNLYNEAQSNERVLTLTSDLYQAGLADYSQVLQAKETWLLSLSALIDSQQALVTDLIAIYKAMGGDW